MQKSGVALLMVLGILALLVVLATAFATFTRLGEHTARDFNYEKQAREIAVAGIERVIAQLKEQARSSFTYTGEGFDDDIKEDNIDLGKGITGKYEVEVIDTASQINVNTANEALLEYLPGIGTETAQTIITQRNDIPFITKQSITLVDGVGADIFDDIKDLITVHGYIDPNVLDEDGVVVSEGQERSAMNINSVIYNLNSNEPREYLEDMLENMFKAVDGIDTLADDIVSALKTYGQSPDFPFESWKEFLDVVDQVSGIGTARLDDINRAFNPNRAKPVDGSDNPTYTTEFCFHSGGIYEITSTSTLTNKKGQVVARKTIKSIVKVFDLWNQSTTQEFWGEDINWNGILDEGEDTNNNEALDTPVYTDIKVTGLDNCPVRSDDNWNGTATIGVGYDEDTEYYTIPGSLKIGYWDSFSPRNDLSPWDDKSSEKTSFTGVADMPFLGEIILGKNNDPRFEWGNCSMTILSIEKRDTANDGNYSANWDDDNSHETGWFIFRSHGWGSENMCSQFYYKTNIDTDPDTTYAPPLSPLVYTIVPSVDKSPKPGEPGVDSIKEFYKTKMFRVIQNRSDPSSNSEEIDIFMKKGDNSVEIIDTDAPIHNDFSSSVSSGWVKLLTYTWIDGSDDGRGGTKWDNLRIISNEGEYTSTSSNEAYNPLDLSEDVEWGRVWGTVTKPDSIDNPGDVDVKIEMPFGTGNYVNFTTGADIEASNSSSIQYRLKFYSNYSDTNKYLKTPVLEDIWITFLPKAKILYWYEGPED